MFKLRCPTKKRLSKYLLGTLDEKHAGKVMTHLDHCNHCEVTVQRMETVSDSVTSRLRGVPPQEDYLREPGYQRLLDVVDAIEVPFQPANSARSGRAHRAGHPQQLHEYRLLTKLGKGGMGAVYKALHTKMDRIVAMKVLPRDRMRKQQAIVRFQREMKVVGKLDHPNIVRAHDAGEADGMHYLVMELVDGADLNRLVKRHGPLSIADSCELVRQTAIGLAYAHQHGMVHRDIKPSNLMVTRDGKVKILDMGLALYPGQPLDNRELTSEGQLMGTVDYMAPEQGDDSHEVDIRADIYSLGATLYKLLCGQAPFAGHQYGSALKKMMALANQPAPPIRERRPEIPESLAGVVHRMLAKNPEDRYETSLKIIQALTPFTADSDVAGLLDNVSHSPTPAAELFAPTQLNDVPDSSMGADSITNSFSTWHPSIHPTSPPVTGTDPRDAPETTLKDPPWFSEKQLALGMALLGATIFLVTFGPNRRERHEYRKSSPTQVAEPSLIANPALPGKSDDDDLDPNIDAPLTTPSYVQATTEEIENLFTRPHSDRPHMSAGPVSFQLDSEAPVLSLTFATDPTDDMDGTTLVAVTRLSAGLICHWDSKDKKFVATDLSGAGVKSVAMSPNSTLVATHGPETRIEIRDLALPADIRIPRVLYGHKDNVTCLALSSDGRTVVSGDKKGRILVWDLGREDLSARLSLSTDLKHKVPRCLLFSPYGRTLASSWSSSEEWSGMEPGPENIVLWHVNSENTFSRLPADAAIAEALHHSSQFAFSPNDRSIATISNPYGMLTIWNTADGLLSKRLEGSDSPVTAFCYRNDSKMMATGHADGIVRQWDLWKLQPQVNQEWAGHDGAVLALAYVADGKHVLSAGKDDNKVYLWRPDSNKRGDPVEGPDDSIVAFAAKPHGTQFAVAGDNNKICIWDLQAKN